MLQNTRVCAVILLLVLVKVFTSYDVPICLYLLDPKPKWRSPEVTGRVSLGQDRVSGLDAHSLSRQLRSRLEASEEEPTRSSRPCGLGSSIWGRMRVSNLCQKGPALPQVDPSSNYGLHPGLTISLPPTEPLLCAVTECVAGGGRVSKHVRTFNPKTTLWTDAIVPVHRWGD